MRLALILVIVAALALVLWFSFGRSGDAWVAPEVERSIAPARVELDGQDLGEDAREPEVSATAAELEPAVPARMLRPDDPMALLRVRVIDVASRKPISGAHVTFRTFGTLPAKTPGGRPEDEAFPTETCGDGLAVRMIQPGARWEILVAPELGTHASSRGEPLVASEERDVLIESTTAPDGMICGRVVARDTNLPIASAIVRIEPKHDVVALAADGTFRAEMRSWRDEGLEVRAPGYGPRWVARVPGHETPERTVTIVLDRGASLRVEVVDSSGNPAPRLLAEIGALQRDLSPETVSDQAGLGRSYWRVTTTAEGIADWVDLPAGVPLTGTLRRNNLLLSREAKAIVLAAGEQRVMTWRLPAMSEVCGVVLDAGTPDPGRKLWLQPSKGEREPILGTVTGEGRRLATSDASGRFRFEHVTPGNWWLAPADPEFGYADPTRDPIALAQIVEVPATTTVLNVEVNLQRGLVIRGRIATPDGGAPVMGRASARRKGVTQLVTTRSNPDGEFVLGPLLPGTWTLVGQGDGLLHTEGVQVDAGATNVLLQLRAAAELQVRVVDAEGIAVPSVVVHVTGERWYGDREKTEANGWAHFRELSPGRTRIGCTLPDGRWGILEQVLEVDRANEVELVLQPGVHGTFRFAGSAASATLTLLRDGAMFGSTELLPAKPTSVTLPTGRLVFRLYADGTFQPDHEIVVVAETTPEFTFDGTWR